jgi:hypothetical protein
MTMHSSGSPWQMTGRVCPHVEANMANKERALAQIPSLSSDDRPNPKIVEDAAARDSLIDFS